MNDVKMMLGKRAAEYYLPGVTKTSNVRRFDSLDPRLKSRSNLSLWK